MRGRKLKLSTHLLICLFIRIKEAPLVLCIHTLESGAQQSSYEAVLLTRTASRTAHLCVICLHFLLEIHILSPLCHCLWNSWSCAGTCHTGCPGSIPAQRTRSETIPHGHWTFDSTPKKALPLEMGKKYIIFVYSMRLKTWKGKSQNKEINYCF